MSTASNPQTIIRKAFRILLILSMQFVVICVVLELGLRLAFTNYVLPGEDSPGIWQYHETYGWIGRPNIDTLFRQPAFAVRIQHNALGQRDEEYSAARNNKKRMLILGDSFVWGYGVENKDSFVDLVDSKHEDWEIINGGIAGTGTDQQYLYLQEMIAYYQPDVVMLLVIQNDFQDNTVHDNHDYYKPYFTLENNKHLALHQVPVPKPRFDQTLQRLVYGRSYLYNATHFLRIVLEKKFYTLIGKEQSPWDPYKGFDFPASIPVTVALLDAMIDTTEKNHARFVLLHGQIIDPMQIVLRDVAQRRHIPLHNLDRAFAGHTHQEYQIPGDAHWNTLGHQWVARDVDLFLQEIGIFTRSGESL